MTWKPYLFLVLLGLLVGVCLAPFQTAPGYMDADYYAVTGLQLASGKGFTEPFLWNYLDDPAGLPHPSHSYWMPLASLIAAIVPALTGSLTWWAARIPFILAAASVPPLTAALAYSLTSRHDLALLSGLLAVFSGYYLPFMLTTDTFGIYMLLGILFILAAGRSASKVTPFLFGLLAGLMHLARADGLTWLVLALFAVMIVKPTRNGKVWYFSFLFLVLAGYLVIMAPWFARNMVVFGTLLAPGGSRALWMTGYNHLFVYPASQVSFSAWKQAGLGAAVQARIWALGMNLGTTLGVQGEVFLLPLILAGLWKLRKNGRTILAAAAWLMIFLAMTLVFPFAGARGGFFHSGAALQPFWWAVAPVGLESLVNWASKRRGWPAIQAGRVFAVTMLVLVAGMSAFIVKGKLGEAWNRESTDYQQVEAFLVSIGAEKSEAVVVANPPGYYYASGRPALVTPDGDGQTARLVAERYGAAYLVLEPGKLVEGLQSLYDNPAQDAGFEYLGEVNEIRIFAIQP